MEKQIDSVLGGISKRANIYNKLLKITDAIDKSVSRIPELKDDIACLSAVIDIIQLSNLSTKINLETIQYAMLMDYLSATGLAEERLETLWQAFNHASQNESNPVDQAIGLAISEIQIELPEQINDLKQSLLNDYFLVGVETLRDSSYVKSKLQSLALGSHIYKSLAKSVVHKLNINGDPLTPSLILGKDLYTSVIEPGNEWRRIHLAANLSYLVSSYATHSPSYRVGWDVIYTDSILAHHEVHDVFDLMTCFQFEYLNRGIALLDSNWYGFISSALDATLTTLKCGPNLYWLYYSSTALSFGKEIGKATAAHIYGDDMNAVKAVLERLVEDSQMRNIALNQWHELIEGKGSIIPILNYLLHNN